jgi:2-polyprenyl-3-methyl-5-hydroxy-6-metoxy-1,4-benzoquinol methylase
MKTGQDNPPAGVPRKLFGAQSEAVRAAFHQWEKVVCPLCHVYPERFATDFLGFHLCRCPECGLQFLNPRPTAEQLTENVYNETYFADSGTTQGFSGSQLYQFGRQLKTIERLRQQSGILLDVGCGGGSFLRYVMGKGWQAAGTDIRLADGAKKLGCPLWEGQLHEINTGGERFDVIRLNHVLEHMQDPLTELMHCCDLLNEGGIVFVSVPNIAGISVLLKNTQSRFRLKRNQWRHYGALHHLWFFSPTTLRRLADRACLHVVYWETPVLGKSAESSFFERFYRSLLENTHSASILDFYMMKKTAANNQADANTCTAPIK